MHSAMSMPGVAPPLPFSPPPRSVSQTVGEVCDVGPDVARRAIDEAGGDADAAVEKLLVAAAAAAPRNPQPPPAGAGAASDGRVAQVVGILASSRALRAALPDVRRRALTESVRAAPSGDIAAG